MAKKLFILCLTAMLLSSCAASKDNNKIHILDIKTATGIDDKYMPIGVTKVFPAGTSRVFLWFSWNNAQKDTKIVARWYYVTDDIPVLDYTFVVPRKQGTGSVSLLMPEGKTLPPGFYRATLEMEDKPLKSVTFKVSDK